MGGGGKDNSAQIQAQQQAQREAAAAQWGAAQSEERVGVAAKYNSQVDEYNNFLGSQLGSLSGLEGQIKGLTIRDDERFGDLGNQLSNLQNTIMGRSFGGVAPNWSKSEMSPWGAAAVSVPALGTVNSGLKDSLNSKIASLGSSLSSLQQQRKAEEDRVRAFQSQANGSLAGLGSRAGSLSINDKNGINQSLADLEQLRASRAGFSSTILDEVDPMMTGGIDSRLASIGDQIGTLKQQREAEMGRVAQFEAGLRDRAIQMDGSVGGLNIANIGGMNDLRSSIGALRRDANGFQTQLDHDFSDEMGMLSPIEQQLNKLFSDRTAEQGRISEAERQMRLSAGSLTSRANQADIYNGANLQDIMSQIAQARTEAGAFTSQLDYNFNDELGLFAGAEATAQGLLAQRKTALDGYSQAAAQGRADLTGLAEYDYDGANKLKQSLGMTASDLTKFFGTDATAIGNDFQGAQKAVDMRLQAITSKRAELEKTAQGLMERVNNGSYYDEAGLTGPQAELAALQDQVKLWNAQQALDELSNTEGKIKGERSRLAKDAADLLRRQQEQQGAGGTQAPTTASEYEALMAYLRTRNRDNEAVVSPAAGGGLSSLLNVIHV